MSDCDPIRELLLDGASLNDESAVHMASCKTCTALSEALGCVALELDALEPTAAPEALVTRTIERVQMLDSAVEPNVFGALATQLGQGWMAMGKLLWMPFAALGRQRGLRLAFAIPAVCVAFLAPLSVIAFLGMGDRASPMGLNQVPTIEARDPSSVDDDRWASNEPESLLDGQEGLDEQDELNGRFWHSDTGGLFDANDEGIVQGGDFIPSEDPASNGAFHFETATLSDSSERSSGYEGDLDGDGLNGIRQSTTVAPAETTGLIAEPADAFQTARDQPPQSAAPAPASERLGWLAENRRGEGEGRFNRDLSITDGEEESRERSDILLGAPDNGRDGNSRPSLRLNNGEDSDRRREGLDGLGRDEVSGLTYRSPTGRWSNTYVPGDPRWRLLARRLRRTGSGVLAGAGVSAFELAQQAQPTTPRIAAPAQSALALSVQSDRAQVEGQTRVLMQVGLRGAAVRGRRPTLRSVVVLDLRNPLDDARRANVRSLLTSISRARTNADRIGIIVAGPHGGTLVEPGPLRLGEVTVALRRAFSAQGGEPTTLNTALASAIQSVSELSDADSPLGSGLVWLVTPGLDSAQASSLESVAHTGALAGVTTTTIGLSPDINDEPLETLALAGHGRRWVIDAQPEQIVRQEIEAVSRVVARAVRLNVRLAPGTRLVGVLGSRSLSEIEAQRTAAAERAVDQQLASRLGIVSDRERDDDGIQIIIPAFYADDTHTILLDLVVEGPGAVADVSIRYKDLLRLDNGESSERLVLSRGRAERGPRQRDVLRSWLAHELSVSLRRAAMQVSSSRPAALAELQRARARLEIARTSLRAPATDRELVHQTELCQRFEAALNAGAAPAVLADSLRFASRRLVFGDPLSTGEGSRR